MSTVRYRDLDARGYDRIALTKGDVLDDGRRIVVHHDDGTHTVIPDRNVISIHHPKESP